MLIKQNSFVIKIQLYCVLNCFMFPFKSTLSYIPFFGVINNVCVN